MSTENGNNGHSAATDCSLVVGVNALPFPDESFLHVVFDPPHMKRQKERGTLTKMR